jgi:hypothetical protein
VIGKSLQMSRSLSERVDNEMRKNIAFPLTFLVLVILTCTSTKTTHAQDSWLKADAEVVRLSPKVFHKLPPHVVRKLVSLGCTIPQAEENSVKHNVIKGRFKRANQTDWAVLCSRERASSILIFWGGSVDSFSEIAKAADSAFLQTIDGGGNIGFSRTIMPVNRAYILQHYREYHGPRPPPVNHEGIDDGFLGKGSTIHYYFRREWLQLQGAD